LWKTQGPGESVQDLLDFDLFLKGKIGGPGARGPVDHDRAAVHGSTMDPRMERGWSSPECWHAGIPMLGT
jgi:hypothetical protein